MSKKELKTYFAWYHEVMPERLEELTRAVHETPGFENWAADYTPASLDLLGEWFAAQVETRPRTAEEIKEIADRSAYPIDIPREELTNATFSLAMDVGMYLSQVFLRTHPSLQWGQPFGSKKFIDYGQPVLEGFGFKVFNPARMLIVQAYGLADKTWSGKSLRELYDIWSEKVGLRG